jgi:GTPase SAR1 family protein
MEKADPHNVRLLLLGDSKVGKTSLRLRLFSYFTDEYYPR